MSAHRFLEIFNETMTVREMRAKLRSSGAIGEGRVPTVPITHILIFRYDIDWRYLVNASQGDNKEEIEKAQNLLKGVQAAYQESHERESDAHAAEEVKAQEDAYNSRTEELKKKSETG